jgi:hypothetical protein
VEGSLCETAGQSPLAGDAVGPAVSGGQQIVRLGDLIEQPERERLAGVQDPAGEQDLLGDGLADQLPEPPGGAGGGQDPEAGLGVAAPHPGCPETEVACVGQLCAAAQGEPVEQRDRWHRQSADPVEKAGVDAPEGVVAPTFAELGDVGAGGERVAFAG